MYEPPREDVVHCEQPPEQSKTPDMTTPTNPAWNEGVESQHVSPVYVGTLGLRSRKCRITEWQCRSTATESSAA